MIDIQLLEQLLTFRECGTLSAAAERLHLAQSSLSRSMQRLEELLGVPLFDRQKNRITLNHAGMLAADYAKKVLDAEEDLVRQVYAFDRSLHTLTIGSCAPGPLMALLPNATGLLSGMAISSAIESEERLLEGLRQGEYGLILLDHPVDEETLYCRKYRSEQLYLSVKPMHPAAAYEQISFADMDGQNFIMFSRVGIWDQIVREKMPNAQFFLQDDVYAVGELARYSELPAFTSDISLKMIGSRQNDRINIPFSDPESRATYYFICRQDEQSKWRALFQE
jgi:DNA-binding transcriptional LysR family regulator